MKDIRIPPQIVSVSALPTVSSGVAAYAFYREDERAGDGWAGQLSGTNIDLPVPAGGTFFISVSFTGEVDFIAEFAALPSVNPSFAHQLFLVVDAPNPGDVMDSPVATVDQVMRLDDATPEEFLPGYGSKTIRFSSHISGMHWVSSSSDVTYSIQPLMTVDGLSTDSYFSGRGLGRFTASIIVIPGYVESNFAWSEGEP